MGTMGLSRTVSEIDGDFSRKSQFSYPRIFYAPVDVVPPRIGYRRKESKKTRMMGLPEGRKRFKIGISVQTQYWRVTDRQTSRHATTAKTALTHSVARVITCVE